MKTEFRKSTQKYTEFILRKTAFCLYSFYIGGTFKSKNMQQPIWGIDLGGTKIEGAIIPSLNHPDPIIRIRVETGSKLGYEHILGQLKLLVDEMKEKSGLIPATIGIGTPGAEEPSTGLMKLANPLKQMLKPF